MNPLEQLMEMLEFCRPAGSVYEEAFIERYLKPYSPHKDDYGNLIIDIGSKPNILWSSHTDTVHKSSKLQRVQFNKKTGLISVKDQKESDCLGADCTTGVWIMMQMLNASVEGRYIFHRAEEVGGLGSKYIAKNTPDMLKGIDAAIAFDRRGKTDIITHQGSETASKAFAYSLADAIEMEHMPSTLGSFTDTKSYMGLVPECTNIAVGYASAHSSNETQDWYYLRQLTKRLVNIDVSGLVISRTPREAPVYTYTRSNYAGGYGGYGLTPLDMFDLIRQNPTSTVKVLEMCGFDFDSLKDAIDTIQSTRTSDADQLPAQLKTKARIVSKTN